LRAEKELLANVSHELRTPLQRIHIALELAREGDAEMTRASLGDIAEDLGELSRIVDDVLTAARLSLRKGDTHDPARTPLRLETTDVRDTIGKAVTRFRAEHPARPLSVTVPEDGVKVVADPVLLRRVVDNLLENAHKYSDDPAAPIELSAARDGERFSIVVADRGVGIAEADLARVFEPFFRADKSRTRATGGLGLGLALSKQIIDAHEGTLSLESRPEHGTTATVRLPLPA
jgi:signal transduction histidine kinase